MNKLQVLIDGGLTVAYKDGMKMPLSQYMYHSKSGEDISAFRILKANDKKYIRFPRNFSKFERFCVSRDDVVYIERRVESDPISFDLSDGFTLRGYQKEPVKNVIAKLLNTRDNSVVLQAEPSFGKTFVLPYIVKALKQKTLILVDRNLLRDQMFSEFTTNSEANVTILENDTEEVGDVTITTFQMLLINPHLIKKFKDEFGMIVVDECHVAPAAKFLEVISSFPAKYRLGLSATPTRSDGLTTIITDTFGYNKVVGSNPDNLKIYNVVVDMNIPVMFSSKKDYSKGFIKAMVNPLSKGEDSPLEIAVNSAVGLYKKGRRVLIYVTYSDLQNLAKQGLEKAGYKVGVIQGKTGKVKRNEIIDDFQKGKIDFLISGVILQKGVSIHALDTIINLATQNKENLEQVRGRLRREKADKREPMFIYFTFGAKLQWGSLETVQQLKDSVQTGDKFAMISVKQYKEKTYE